MAYTTINKSTDYFNTKLYSGNGSSQSITGVGFQPDWTWVKSRSGTYGAYNPQAYDAVRGAGTSKDLTPATNAVEGVDNGIYGHISSFDTDGFTLGAGSSNSTQNNGSSTEYVSWNWKANGAGSSNTDGYINSTVSANTTAGFSIVTYTGNLSSSTSATVGHGLGVAPKMIITKRLSNTSEWAVLHEGLTSWNYVCWLNETDAQIDKSGNGSMSAPTSTVFSTNYTNALNVNSSTYVAYCFAEKTGYSKFGSYTGNGNAEGTFIYLGFKPAFIMTKRIDNTGAWLMYDSKRNPSNLTDKKLLANENGAENASVSPSGVIASTNNIDIVSNGFKQRTTQGYNNASGGNYIYMAFAEEPLVANVGQSIPATAR